MALCIRAIVYLYKLVGGEILGFSMVHNSTAVRIYGHYPVINKNDGSVAYHHHNIATFVLKIDNRWKAYRFVMALYREWAPAHLERIRRVVDSLPEEINQAKPELGEGGDEYAIGEDEWPSQNLPDSTEWNPSRGGES
ncbi:hypothetical protein BJX63DRAFT_430753 [Aspergillus granulosus]|uniref:DUF7924 domain-containing protein n=1 Tax=Aspergillus granulosus TaxID=176169 RepID=A0ABR4HL96_9EURO